MDSSNNVKFKFEIEGLKMEFEGPNIRDVEPMMRQFEKNSRASREEKINSEFWKWAAIGVCEIVVVGAGGYLFYVYVLGSPTMVVMATSAKEYILPCCPTKEIAVKFVNDLFKDHLSVMAAAVCATFSYIIGHQFFGNRSAL